MVDQDRPEGFNGAAILIHHVQKAITEMDTTLFRPSLKDLIEVSTQPPTIIFRNPDGGISKIRSGVRDHSPIIIDQPATTFKQKPFKGHMTTYQIL